MEPEESNASSRMVGTCILLTVWGWGCIALGVWAASCG